MTETPQDDTFAADPTSDDPERDDVGQSDEEGLPEPDGE
jgi:hypothetical protein